MAEKILVVDDEPESLKLIGLLLHRQGYQTIAAHNGAQALDLAARELPDLVVLDVMMPDMDGYEVCRRMRANPALARIPIMMFTAKTMVDDKVAGFEAGADDYLTKPIHPAELASRVRAVLARSKLTHAVVNNKRGKVIAVLGAKGGVGATTTAINLAVTLVQSQQDVILAELRPGAGTAGLQLGFSRAYGVNVLAGRLPQAMDATAIDGQLLAHKSGLRLLGSSHNPHDLSGALAPERAEAMVRQLIGMADFVVVDLGTGLASVNQRIAQIADLVLVCTEPQRITLTLSLALLGELEKLGVGEGRAEVVLLNHSRSGMAVSFQIVESLLQRKVFAVISPAPELAFQAAEGGTPMVTLQPDSLTADQFRELTKHAVERLLPGVQSPTHKVTTKSLAS